ncbi:MAG: hypothetical protein EON58_05350 [Alphaproteobacteria bacterium]|nr:MAG: hypothetical protein EON58_05350 [Alphaproteobacteria bacterium]
MTFCKDSFAHCCNGLLGKHIILLIAMCTCHNSIAGVREDRKAGDQSIRFVATEFTQPQLDIGPDGSKFYFDLLGEIYSAPLKGGQAMQIELGQGWKTRPMLSPDGKRLAFLSDLGGPIGLWVKTLGSPSEPVPYDTRANADVMTAAWISDSNLVTSGRGLSDIGGYSLSTTSESGPLALSIAGSWPSGRFAASMTASRDGNFVYFIRRGKLRRLELSTGIEGEIAGLPPGASQLRMAPDDVHLGFVEAVKRIDLERLKGPSYLSLMDLATGKITTTSCSMEPAADVDGDGPPNAAYAFLPDSKGILSSLGGKIRKCIFEGGTRSIPIRANVSIKIAPRAQIGTAAVGAQLRYPAPSPDGSKIAFTARGKISVLSTATGTTRRLTTHSQLEYMPSFSSDGSKIAYVAIEDDGSSSLKIRHVESGSEHVILSTNHVLANPSWSPDGKRIAFTEVPANSYNKSEIEIVSVDVATGESVSLVTGLQPRDHAKRVYPSAQWDRGSNGIFYLAGASGDPFQSLMYKEIGKEPAILYQLDWSILNASISPSGKVVALQDRKGILIAPSAGSSFEKITLDGDVLSGLKRIVHDDVDYMVWTRDDRIAWIVQNEIVVSDQRFEPRNHFKVEVAKEPQVPPPGRIAYVGARLLPMVGTGEITKGLIITNGAAIEYVGNYSKALIGNAEVRDVKGKTIIPGLIDVHQHDYWMNFDVTPHLNQRLFNNAAYGVTTVFDPSYPDLEASVLQESSADGDYPGATFYSSGSALLGQTGIQLYTEIESYKDALLLMRRKKRMGIRMVKDYLQPTRSQSRWLADAGRELGIGITAHEQNNLRTHMALVVAGFGALEHSIFLRAGHVYADVRKLLVESGIAMTPALADDQGLRFFATSPPSRIRVDCLTTDMSRKRLEEPRPDFEAMSLERTQKFETAEQYAEILNQGGRVSVGAHNLPAGIGTHWEMWLLGMAGATPENALRAATVNGALKLGLEGKIGSLAAGLDADFVVLNSNPLDDLKNTIDISEVVRRGRTLTWPTGRTHSTTWTTKESWQTCKDWNLGVGSVTPFGPRESFVRH